MTDFANLTPEQIAADIWVRRALLTATFTEDGVQAFAKYSRTFIDARAYFRTLPNADLRALQESVRAAIKATETKTSCCRSV